MSPAHSPMFRTRAEAVAWSEQQKAMAEWRKFHRERGAGQANPGRSLSVDKIRAAVLALRARHLDEHEITLAVMERELNVNERTIQRALRDIGTNWRAFKRTN